MIGSRTAILMNDAPGPRRLQDFAIFLLCQHALRIRRSCHLALRDSNANGPSLHRRAGILVDFRHRVLIFFFRNFSPLFYWR